MNILLSGGARGADSVFAVEAHLANHKIWHMSFEGHRISVVGEVFKLSQAALNEADPYVEAAGKVLDRWMPNNDFVMNLLRRNYYQIQDTNRVYAVAPIDDEGMVMGGTAWAVQMAINRGVPDIYVFDLIEKHWLKSCHAEFTSAHWEHIIGLPPKPHGIYTGIGSREITAKGRAAIRELYAQ